MDLQTLTDALRNCSSGDYQWTFCLYTSKKSKDGIELEISRCEMQDIAGLIDATIVNMLEKALPERTVAEYSPFLTKEVIGALEQDHELVKESLQDILSSVKHAFAYAAEDYMTGVAPSPTGYLCYGCKTDENEEITDQVLFMKRSNPFMKSGKSRLCLSSSGKIVPSDAPMLKFALSADLLLIGGICYILSPGIEKDLGLENRQIAFAEKRMGVIAQSAIVNNYEELEKTAYSAKNARKFLDFDREVLDYIVRLPIAERTDFLSEYGLTSDSQGLIDTSDPDQCELLIDLLCGRSCHDALGRLSVGSNIMPRQ